MQPGMPRTVSSISLGYTFWGQHVFSVLYYFGLTLRWSYYVYVALASLELVMKTRLVSNLESCLPLHPKCYGILCGYLLYSDPLTCGSGQVFRQVTDIMYSAHLFPFPTLCLIFHLPQSLQGRN